MIEELTGTRKKKQPGYLLWYDDDPKISTVQKIEEALEAYVKSKRWKQRPNIVLVNEADVVDVSDVTVRSTSHVRRNHFWIGREEPVGVVASDEEDRPAVAAPEVELTKPQVVVADPQPAARERRRVATVAHTEELPPEPETVSQIDQQPTAVKSRGAKKRVAEVQAVIEEPVAVEAKPSRKTQRKAKASAEDLLPPVVEVVGEPLAEQEPPVAVGLQRKRSRKTQADTMAARAAELLPPVEEAVAEPQTTRKARGKVKAAAVAEELPPPVLEASEAVAVEPQPRHSRKTRADTVAAQVAELLPPVAPIIEEAAIVEPEVTARKVRGKAKDVAIAEDVSPVAQASIEPTRESQPPRKTGRSPKADVVTVEAVPPVAGVSAEARPARKTRDSVKAQVEQTVPAVTSSVEPVAAAGRTRRKRQPVQADFEQSSLPL